MMKKIFTLSILGLTLGIIASAACVSASSAAYVSASSVVYASASSFIIKVQIGTLQVQNVKADQVMVWDDYNVYNQFKATFDEQPGHNYYKVDLPPYKTYTIDILKNGYKEKIVSGVSIANGEITIHLQKTIASASCSLSTLTALPLLRSI